MAAGVKDFVRLSRWEEGLDVREVVVLVDELVAASQMDEEDGVRGLAEVVAALALEPFRGIRSGKTS